jgi:hypothetical protein
MASIRRMSSGELDVKGEPLGYEHWYGLCCEAGSQPLSVGLLDRTPSLLCRTCCILHGASAYALLSRDTRAYVISSKFASFKYLELYNRLGHCSQLGDIQRRQAPSAQAPLTRLGSLRQSRRFACLRVCDDGSPSRLFASAQSCCQECQFSVSLESLTSRDSCCPMLHARPRYHF